ncbi:HNH endonuclease domain-containing protein [Luteolibacter sp. Populi]|uniref:HNH endonuclease domain-containing protein n=1 Tax=Luteolibacter sp. Populi TaxID=3230487 RepID=UPI003466F6FA
MALTFAFDIGYASIGWCVLSAQKKAPADPDILGTGVVTFPTDDCLASTRRDLRRTRRHIRSTRMRIERMKRWLLHRGVLSREDLDRPGHPAPFLLAAAALQGHRVLSAWELWTILRWYAHNRGYDGNSRWPRGEENDEDTEKERNAMELMNGNGTSTMAETVCACLDLKPSGHGHKISSLLPYKTLNAAYPRKVVTGEVGRLLSLHLDKIPGLDSSSVRLLMSADELGKDARTALAGAAIKLPKRYVGGLLFGQLLPRFDNRIIARCPITWAKTYLDALKAGKDEKEARHAADKYAKVPSAKCREFFRYRFAMLLANLKVDDNRPLSRDLRRKLWNLAEEQGRLTHKDLKSEIKAAGHKPFNLDAYFKIHPDSEDALTLDPVIEFPNKNQIVKVLWPALTEAARTEALARWKKGGATTPAELHELSGQSAASMVAIQAVFDKDQDKAKSKRNYAAIDDLLNRRLSPAAISGRAPYARPVLEAVVAEVLAGPWHPRKADKTTDPEDGEDKPQKGVLYDLGIPTSHVRQLQDGRPLDQLTNNHLVRHRLLILDRLLDDILAEFCPDGQEVERAIVEVARELREFSGMTAKAITAELNSRLKDFKGAVAYLDKNAPNLERNGGIIRKCRIAIDLGWKCPFTGETYDACDLPSMEREHIIPYATRNTNALHAMVLTWPAVNRMKGKRTARQFIAENEGRTVDGMDRLSLFTLRGYDEFVGKLDTKGHPDDARRKRARKALLETNDFEDKELGFTEGHLTQSSHLMKLAMRGMKQKLPRTQVDPIPGPVTSEIRKSWKLMGTLALACPEIIDPSSKEVRPKDEIRGLTHLHHALDAATLALAAHYFPLQSRGQDQKGKIWLAMLRRYRTPEEKEFLFRLGIFDRYQRTRRDKQGNETVENDVRLRDLPAVVKEKVARSLAQCRVMQHLPSDRSGVKAELTTWGVTSIEGEGNDARVKLRQRTSKVEGGRRVLEMKTREERAGKLLGVNPKGGKGKLKEIQGAMIIGENYGLALDPVPEVIPFHQVQERLKKLQTANAGDPVRVLRNGMLIRLKTSPAQSRQDYSGIWRIASIKNNKGKFLVDMIRPSYVTPQNGVAWAGMNKTLGPLLEAGLEILPRNYAGHSAGK